MDDHARDRTAPDPATEEPDVTGAAGTGPDATGATGTGPDATESHGPLATGPRGMTLLSFHRMPEDSEFVDAPVAYALVLLRHRGRALMVYERHRACWELPGGRIEPGERAREAAVREVWEEAGQRVRPEELRLAGFARTALGPERRVLYGALFTAVVDTVQPFVPNDEVSAVHWRTGTEPLPGGGTVQTVDEYLVALAGGHT